MPDTFLWSCRIEPPRELKCRFLGLRSPKNLIQQVCVGAWGMGTDTYLSNLPGKAEASQAWEALGAALHGSPEAWWDACSCGLQGPMAWVHPGSRTCCGPLLCYLATLCLGFLLCEMEIGTSLAVQ